jgi:hypothetical protein
VWASSRNRNRPVAERAQVRFAESRRLSVFLRVHKRSGRNGFGNKIFQVVWTGAKYSLTDKLDVIAAYYHYTQNSYFGTAKTGPVLCDGSEHAQCAGTFNAISGVIDWLFAPKWDLYLGIMSTKVNGGLANGYLERGNVATTAGLRFRF